MISMIRVLLTMGKRGINLGCCIMNSAAKMPRLVSPLPMKLTLLVFLCGLSAALAGDMPLHIVRHNQPIHVENAAQFTTNVISFLESASVDATAHGGGQARWREVLASGSYIHLTFPTPRTFRLPVMAQNVQRREGTPVSEILVSLPDGRYPAIQVRSGTNYMAVTKWQPGALGRLVREPALELSTVQQYDHFYRLDESGR